MKLEEEIALLLYGELHGCTDAQTREEFHFADGGPAVTARHRKLDRDFFRAEIEHLRSVGAKVAALARSPRLQGRHGLQSTPAEDSPLACELGQLAQRHGLRGAVLISFTGERIGVNSLWRA